ncbi:sigma-70 family RNA polymerase sigma factor [bacterium]|nr:MAG: sigma-70 family RNA polymerase sigma factor [bacterium]
MRTDEDLARAFAAGDNLAFAALYSRYKQPVYIFALRMLREPDKAKDAFQSAFLKAFECRTELARVVRFRSWIFTVVRNLCLNELRRSKSIDSSYEEMDDLPGGDHETTLEQEDEARVLMKAIGYLKPEYREVLLLREYEDLAYEEIAAVIGSTESAVKSRLYKARQQLHRMLQPYVGKG